MTRLIPGRIRNQGIELYQAQAVDLIEERDSELVFSVAGREVLYDLNNDSDWCSCELFQTKHFCEHLAGADTYVKYEHVIEEQEVESDSSLPSTGLVFAQRFLEDLCLPNQTSVTYRLSAFGELTSHVQKIWWTLKIQRFPDKRSYVIKDIPAFLRTVRQGQAYQIGKNYLESLALQQFDAPSQDLLQFLWAVETGDSQVFFPNNRFLYLPIGFLEDGLPLLNHLSEMLLEIHGRRYRQTSARMLTATDALYQFKVVPDLRAITLTIEEQAEFFFDQGKALFYRGDFYLLDSQQERLAQAIKGLPLDEQGNRQLQVAWQDQELLALRLHDFSILGQVEAPLSFQVRSFEPQFWLDLTDDQLELKMAWHFDGLQVSSQKELDNLPFMSHHDQIQTIKQVLKNQGFSGLFQARRLLLGQDALYDFFEKDLLALQQLGQVNLSPALSDLKMEIKPNLHLNKMGDLLEVSFDFSDLSPKDIALARQSLAANQSYFINQAGQLVLFDNEFLKLNQTLGQSDWAKQEEESYQLPLWASLELQGHLSGYQGLRLNQELQQLVDDLSSPEHFDVTLPDLQASLRDYQLKGLKWFSVLDHYGFGGILADDMGLGKTLQTIAFLADKLKDEPSVLILSPASLIHNWAEEFQKFLPQATTQVIYGNKAERLQQLRQNHQVTIASYQSFRQDIDLYEANGYDYLILDEAQVLKNSQTKIFQALKRFSVKRIFALSGTPIENKLLDIWSIFHLVLPGLLGSKQSFSKRSAQEVAQLIRPFVLRRRKEEVLAELPDLVETTYQNELSHQQKSYYLAQLNALRQQVEQLDTASFSRQKLMVLAGLLRLRQICNSPSLFTDYDGPSGKLESLKELLQQLKASGRRPLIFSQFRGMLDLVEKELQEQGFSFYKITGSTPTRDRQQMTKVFNKGSRDAVLMSLKAGGVGLNLTGADTVILIDLWWNPAVDMQAIGRAHRFGQERQVTVYRLITHGTIEEKILQLQDAKKRLVKDVLDTEEENAQLSLDDIKLILGIS